MEKLIMFWGRECPHCKVMMPLVDKVEKEAGVTIKRLEVWHNEENADLMRFYREKIAAVCGGQLRVPTFINTETDLVMCGEIPYTTLKKWATKTT